MSNECLTHHSLLITHKKTPTRNGSSAGVVRFQIVKQSKTKAQNYGKKTKDQAAFFNRKFSHDSIIR